MPRFAVDVLDVVLGLLRTELAEGITVQASIPDGVPGVVPLVVVRRTSGQSRAPEFWDDAVVNVQCWCAPIGEVDAMRAASALADDCRRILWTALRQQVVTPGGHIVDIDEHQSPMEVGDVDLPHLGRYSATYRLRMRPARPV